MSISIRMKNPEIDLIKKYAVLNDTTVSEVMRKAILEKIENEFDILLYEKAKENLNYNPKTYTLDEVKTLLNID